MQKHADIIYNIGRLSQGFPSLMHGGGMGVQSHSVKNAEDFHISLSFKINYVHSSATLNQHPALCFFTKLRCFFIS